MDVKKYFMPTLFVFVVIMIFNIIFHGYIMENLYLSNSHFFRPQDEIQKHRYFMWIANLIYSFAFCYIYSKGHEKKEDPLAQGIRFGLWMSLLIWLPHTIINLTIFPYPKSLEVAWLAGYITQSVLAGITAAVVMAKAKS